jgi:hypothetical protein
MPFPYRGFTITLRHTTLGRTPLDEWSARHRDLYLTTHNTHNRQTDRHPCRRRDSKLTIQASERRQTHAVDRAAKWELHVHVRSYHSFLSSINLIISFIRDGLKVVTGCFSTGLVRFQGRELGRGVKQMACAWPTKVRLLHSSVRSDTKDQPRNEKHSSQVPQPRTWTQTRKNQ